MKNRFVKTTASIIAVVSLLSLCSCHDDRGEKESTVSSETTTVDADIAKIGDWTLSPQKTFKELKLMEIDVMYENIAKEAFGLMCFTDDSGSGAINHKGEIIIPVDTEFFGWCSICLQFQTNMEKSYNADGEVPDKGGHCGLPSEVYYNTELKTTLRSGMGEFTKLNKPSVCRQIKNYKLDENVNDGFPTFDKFDKFIIFDGEKAVNDTLYDDYKAMSEDIACVKLNSKWSFVNLKGETVGAKSYDDVGIFSCGVAPVCKNGKWGFINKEGKKAIGFIYDNALPAYEGLAWVQKDGKWGVLKVANI